MPSSLKSSIKSYQTVKGTETASILKDAVTQRSPVQFELEHQSTEPIVNGEFFSLEDSKITIRLHDTTESMIKCLSMKSFKIFFEVSGSRYAFDTQLTEPINATPKSFIVDKPKKIFLVERRRTIRRRLRQPTVVHLYNKKDDTKWEIRATMLNTSEHGLACRMDTQGVAALSVGQMIEVEFRLGGEAESFRLITKVVNITDGGSENQSVLGVEFVEHPQFETEHQRLHDALHSSQ